MKEIRLVAIVVLVALVFMPMSLFAKHDGDSGKMSPNAGSAVKYEKYAKGYEGQAHDYDKKATNSEGEKAAEYKKMASNLRGCAAQKRRMSEAYATGDSALLKSARAEYSSLCKERKALQPPCKSEKCGDKKAKIVAADKKSCKPKSCASANKSCKVRTCRSSDKTKQNCSKTAKMQNNVDPLQSIDALQKKLDHHNKSFKNEGFAF